METIHQILERQHITKGLGNGYEGETVKTFCFNDILNSISFSLANDLIGSKYAGELLQRATENLSSIFKDLNVVGDLIINRVSNQNEGSTTLHTDEKNIVINYSESPNLFAVRMKIHDIEKYHNEVSMYQDDVDNFPKNVKDFADEVFETWELAQKHLTEQEFKQFQINFIKDLGSSSTMFDMMFGVRFILSEEDDNMIVNQIKENYIK